ncbi:MAG: VOC family protein [Cryomorphaceae bacterium]
MEAPFHLSMPCLSVQKTKAFYIDVLGASLGRNTSGWVDINLYGNQITFTKSGDFKFSYGNYRLGDFVIPAFHFGVLLGREEWENVFSRIEKAEYQPTEKQKFMNGSAGEHQSFFIKDPNGYTVEFKCFKTQAEIFKS